MSLRTKILGLFLALMLIPMLVVSAGNYVQAMRSLRSLMVAKLEAANELSASRIETVGRETRARLASVARSSQLARLIDDADDGAAWADLEPALETFASVELRPGGGEPVVIVARGPASAGPSLSCGDSSATLLEIAEPVGQGRGELVGFLPASAALPQDAMQAWFGRNGQQLLIDRGTGRVVFDARCAGGVAVATRPPAPEWRWSDSGSGRGRVWLTEDGVEKSGAFIDIASLPLRVVTVADIEEFVGPYRSEQLLYMAFVAFILLAAGGGFVILAQDTMGSLRELTVASERIGEGDLTPWLPPPGPDEVGRLSQAFSLMLDRLKAMMRQNEVARRLAVAGEVTAQLSHEIRNPLSSIRLNLQSIEREVRRDSVPTDLPQVLRLCLREIDRLDEAVGSVLELGQPRAPEFRPCEVGAVVADSMRIVEPRFRARRIEAAFERGTECGRVLGDEGQLRGVFLNLFLNAIDAMPAGGTLRVWTDCGKDGAGGIDLRVHVLDSGPGVRNEIRSLVFEPFFTTKPGGSGIGLPAAAQTVSAHGGQLLLEDEPHAAGSGAHFVVRLPAVPAAAGNGAGSGSSGEKPEIRPWRPAVNGRQGSRA